MLCVITLSLTGCGQGGQGKGQAVDFTVKDVAGQEYTLSSYYGKGGTVLIFFDRAAIDCKTMLTNLAVAKEGTSVRTVLVAKGEKDGGEIAAYLTENQLSADVIIPDETGEICAKYGVDACPVIYFVDKDGVVKDASLSANLTLSAAQKYIGYIAG